MRVTNCPQAGQYKLRGKKGMVTGGKNQDYSAAEQQEGSNGGLSDQSGFNELPGNTPSSRSSLRATLDRPPHPKSEEKGYETKQKGDTIRGGVHPAIVLGDVTFSPWLSSKERKKLSEKKNDIRGP